MAAGAVSAVDATVEPRAVAPVRPRESSVGRGFAFADAPGTRAAAGAAFSLPPAAADAEDRSGAGFDDDRQAAAGRAGPDGSASAFLAQLFAQQDEAVAVSGRAAGAAAYGRVAAITAPAEPVQRQDVLLPPLSSGRALDLVA